MERSNNPPDKLPSPRVGNLFEPLIANPPIDWNIRRFLPVVPGEPAFLVLAIMDMLIALIWFKGGQSGIMGLMAGLIICLVFLVSCSDISFASTIAGPRACLVCVVLVKSWNQLLRPIMAPMAGICFFCSCFCLYVYASTLRIQEGSERVEVWELKETKKEEKNGNGMKKNGN